MIENELSKTNLRVSSLKNTDELQFRASSDLIAMLVLNELTKLNLAISEMNVKNKPKKEATI